jgi:hypothetical protein
MSESTSSGSSSSSHPATSYAEPALPSAQNGLVRLGGALGVAGSCVGLVIFLVACAGFDAAFHGFPLIPLILGAIGLVCSLVGVLRPKHEAVEDTRVVASFFVSAIAIIGALVEMSIWFKWVIFTNT